METIDILVVIDGLDKPLLGDMFRQRELHYETVDLRIVVELLNLGKEGLFGHIILKPDQCRCKTAFLAGFHLVCHICLASAVVSHKNGGKMRAAFALGNHPVHLSSNFLLDFSCDFFSVDQFHIVAILEIS